MTIDLTKIDRPFGKLSREEQEALVVAAYVDKRPMQVLEGCFQTTSYPSFGPNCIYRVEPEPLTKPSINWDHVSSEYNFMATDEFRGMTWLHTERPEIRNDSWSTIGSPVAKASGFVSFQPGTCDWKDSLVERPK